MSRLFSTHTAVLFVTWLICAARVYAAYIPDSGQSKCYDTAGAEISCTDTGQDGEYTAGATWPPARFTANSDATVSDTLTGLSWGKDGNTAGPAACGPGTAKTWVNAFNYINCLNTNSYLSHNDWRLPGIQELRSLINYGSAKQSTWLIASGFTNIKDLDYWSSTTATGTTTSGWTVNLGTGGVTNILGKTTANYILPVRSGLDAASLLPIAYSFGSITSGTYSTPKEFSIINGGASALTVSNISITGSDAAQFMVASGGSSPCGSLIPTIQAGASCSVIVTFAPTNTGPKEASLSVTENSVSRPTISSPVTGISDAATIIVTRDSGQSKCYDTAGAEISCTDTGQDGEYTAGATWPTTRFTVNSDATVADVLTGLSWGKDGNTAGPSACGPGTTKTWVNAFNYIKCLNTNNYLGHNDWRIPGIRELRSLINYGQAKQSTWLIASGFINIKDLDYWSSTTATGTTTSSWTVNLGTGGITNILGKTTANYILPVRGGLDAASLLPISYSFGSITNATSSAAKEFSIINGGASAFTVSNISITGSDAAQFIVVSGGSSPCGSLTPTIQAGASCSVIVTFAPTITGPKEASLSVTENSVSRPTMSSPVTGISEAATIIVTRDSGQSKCYDTAGAEISCTDTGQDGEYTAGATWPTTRFTVNSDATVADALTGLSWGKDGNTAGSAACSPGTAKTWVNAFNYINCLNTNNYLGHNDWRLPGIRELRSLINYGSAKQSTWLIASGFTNIKDLDYWSSTTVVGTTTSGWTVNLGTGGVTNIIGKTTANYILPVRSGLSAKPGDCDSSGTVTIAEVQSAINMFLGLKAVEACVDQDNNSSVSIAEVQKVINSFLGL